jgi:hypothetical protein
VSRRGWVRRRWRGIAGSLAALGLVAAGWFWGPGVAREMDTFRVRQVEVVGTRFLEPYSVVRAAGLTAGSSLFDDARAWRSGVRTLALVEEVRVRRHFPSKVVVEVREVEPVALVSAGTLRPVDASGRLLELEAAGSILDLPVVTGVEVEDDAVAVGASASAVVTVAALRARAGDLADRVSQAELVGEDLWLSFRDSRAMAVVPAAATRVELTQLRLALSDLVARGELAQVRTIDVRFRDQVVVSFLNRAVIR